MAQTSGLDLDLGQLFGFIRFPAGNAEVVGDDAGVALTANGSQSLSPVG